MQHVDHPAREQPEATRVKAAHFRISVHRNSENLHLKLLGDFDGSSACELLNTLRTLGRGSRQVFIHTTCLKGLDPSGRDLFRRGLGDLKTRSFQLCFTGEFASQMDPRRETVQGPGP